MDNNDEGLSDLVAPNETLEDLRKLSIRCRDLLKQIAASNDTEDGPELRKARDLMTSFNIWSINMGAYLDGRQSIASRLKRSPRISKLVQQLLIVLELELESAAEQMPGGDYKGENESYSGSDNHGSSDRSSISYRLLDVQTTDDGDGRPSSPYSSSWSSIQTTITSLRQVEMTVHLAGAAHRQRRIQHYQARHLGWYKMHERIAREKIDRNMEFQNASDILRERAAKSIATRRMRFSYLERHKEKMTTLDEPVPVPQEDRNNTPAFQLNQQPTIKVSLSYQNALEQGSHVQSSSYTVPTQLDSTKLDPGHMSTKHAESVFSVRITNFKNFPSPPAIDRKINSFACPFCLLECPAKEASDREAWWNHVINDLQPVFCVFDDCTSPFVCGKGFTGWLEHMRDKHTTPEWRCWHCKTTSLHARSFPTPEDLDMHLEQEHRDQVTDLSRPLLVKHSMIRPNHALWKSGCPFCGGFPKEVEPDPSKWENESVLVKLEKHVKDHLVSVALILLPRETETTASQPDRAQSESHKAGRDWSESESETNFHGVGTKYELECSSDGCDRTLRSDLDFKNDISPGHDISDTAQTYGDIEPTWRLIQDQKAQEYENHSPPQTLFHHGSLSQLPVLEDSLLEDSVADHQFTEDQIPQEALHDSQWPRNTDLAEQGTRGQKASRATRSSISSLTTIFKRKEQKAGDQHPITSMATTDDLYGTLRDYRLTDTLSSRRKYIPNSVLRKIVLRDNVIADLYKHRTRTLNPLARQRDSSKRLADRILKRGTKLFAVFINLKLSWEIKELLDAGFTDEDLPLLKSGNRLTSSVDPAKTFEWPDKWGSEKVDYFADTQWLVLAPVFRTGGAHRDLAQECPLPFVEVKEVSGGPNSVVYKVLIESSHHEGFEIEAPSLEVALKEFRYKDDFEIERNSLNTIRGLCANKHITQNLDTFSQGNKTYIMFPWAEGGDLDNFWYKKNLEVRSPQLAVWCLRQMLGLAEALEILHEANIRHGDLHPGHILNFLTEGPYGVLKIAGFGNSRVLKIETLQKHETVTRTRATRPSYEDPEALLADIPPSRKSDIWSLGCIFLDFTIWFIRDWIAVEEFSFARRHPSWGDYNYAQFYRRMDGTTEGNIEVRPAVIDHITSLRSVPECAEGTAFGLLLNIIEFKLIRVEVDERVDAKTLCELLTEVLKRAHPD